MIRIIHTSDLHLDAEVFSEDKKRCELRKKERRALFANLMMYARDQHADLLFICGDFFDKPMPDEETRALVTREFENTPSTEIFIACGRSDPYRPGSFLHDVSFPENVHIFKDERLTPVELPRLNARVYGYSFCRRNSERSRLALTPELDRGYINLFCGVTSLEGDERCAPVTAEQIERAGFDYLALGGEHQPTELLKAGESYYAMSGSPEGVDFDDCGSRSVRIVAMDKREGELLLQSKRIGLSRRRFEKTEISVEGQTDLTASAQAALAYIREKELDADVFFKVRLYGRVPYTFRFDDKAYDKVRSRVAYFCLSDETEMLCSDAKIKKEDFKAVFQATVAAKIDDPELRSKVLKKGLAALEAPEKEHT